MIPFPLFLALRYLRPRRNFASIVTVLSVLGVIFGVAILEIVLAIMTGFGNTWREKVLSFKPHIVVQSESGYIHDIEPLISAIEKSDPAIRGVCPAIQTPVMLKHGETILPAVVIGMDPGRASIMEEIKRKTTGRFNLEDRNCVIGDDLAWNLGIFTSGDQLLVYSPMNLISPDDLYLPEDSFVSGVFDMGMYDYDSTFVLASLEMARDLIGEFDGAQSLQIQVENPEAVGGVIASIEKALLSFDDFFRVQSWQEVDKTLFGVLKTEKTMMFVLLVFITIVAVFCVTNTLIVITIQKTNEIGLLKALGFSSRQLMWAFLLHSQIQCFVGTTLGVVSGWLVLKNLQKIIIFLTNWNIKVFPPEIYHFSKIPWQIIPEDVGLIVVSVYLFCALASLLPAWRAARMDPVVALRQE